MFDGILFDCGLDTGGIDARALVWRSRERPKAMAVAPILSSGLPSSSLMWKTLVLVWESLTCVTRVSGWYGSGSVAPITS